MGDLTDAKDYHPSALTNRLVDRVNHLAAQGLRIIILMGNHDYLRAGHAYFEFLNVIPGVTFVTHPWEDLSDGVAGLWLPHTKTPVKDWAALDTTHFSYVFMHQTVGGAVASNGQVMEDEGVPDMSAWCKVFSGDIHVPQIVKHVEYVGSPYHVHFGDKFKPRCVLLDQRGRQVDVHFETVSRTTVTVSSLRELKRAEIKAGDQVKIRMDLAEADKHDWSRLRRLAVDYLKDLGAEVHGVELRVQKADIQLRSRKEVQVVSPQDSVVAFAAANELGGDALEEALWVIET